MPNIIRIYQQKLPLDLPRLSLWPFRADANLNFQQGVKNVSLGRLVEISKVFVDEGLGFLTSRRKDTPTASGADAAAAEIASKALSDRETAIRLRRTLERLGPTFVKFGQLLATRVDLFSEDFLDELGKLHSSVPPFPHELAVKIIERELGRPIAETFKHLPDAPIASASIAQVYKATLLDGREVAVKVQRPNLEQSLLEDMEILVQISSWIDALVPHYRRSMVHLVAQEYARRAKIEIDFVAEANSIERFQTLLEGDAYFKVPYVLREYSSERLIILEWLEGRKLDQFRNAQEISAVGFDAEELCRNLLRLQLCMAYEFGFVHGDTHPGNLILLDGNRIGLIDFGLTATIGKKLQDNMLFTMSYQSNGQIDKLVNIMTEITPPANPEDLPKYKADLKVVCENMKQGDNINQTKISAQLISGIRTGAKYNAKAQPDLLIVIRNLSIIEGIVLRFNPELKPLAELKEIIQGIIARRFSPKSMADQITPMLADLMLAFSRRPETVERVLALERRFLNSKNLGDFLRLEEVIPSQHQKRGSGEWLQLLISSLILLALIKIAFLAGS